MEEIVSRIDSQQLSQIKNQFALRERINSERYELRQAERKSPGVLFDSPRTTLTFSDATLQGPSYPLELDGKGGLKLSSNYDRLGEQILEVLQTRIGERLYRPFFGIPELLFETIDEYTLSQTIRSQLEASLPITPNLSVAVELFEDGRVAIMVGYSVEGSESQIVKYSFTL